PNRWYCERARAAGSDTSRCGPIQDPRARSRDPRRPDDRAGRARAAHRRRARQTLTVARGRRGRRGAASTESAAAATGWRPRVMLSDELRIDTPEQVALELPIAGVGSRFLAIVVDTLLQAVLYLLVAILFIALGPAMITGAT